MKPRLIENKALFLEIKKNVAENSLQEFLISLSVIPFQRAHDVEMTSY